jgi:hypothetical protein
MARKDPWQRTATILWSLLFVLWSIRAAVAPDRIGVFPIFGTASRRWWEWLPVYVPYEGLDIFRYTPTFAVLFLPFAAPPFWLGSVLWNLLSIGLLYLALRVLARRLLCWSWSPRQEGVFLVLAVLGSTRGIWSAQTNAVVMALVIFAAAAILDRRWWTAIGCLALPVFIKMWPIALVMLLWVYWPKQITGRFAAACATLAAVPFLTAPPRYVLEQYGGFVARQIESSQLRWEGFRDAWTIWEAFGEPHAGIYLVLQGVGAAAVLGWCLWQRRRLGLGPRLLAVTLAIWASWQLLLGPGTERLTYGLIAPFTAAAVVQSFAVKRLRGLSLAAWLMTVILGAGRFERLLLPYFSWSPAIQPLGVAVFVVWLLLFEAGPEPSRAMPAAAVAAHP